MELVPKRSCMRSYRIRFYKLKKAMIKQKCSKSSNPDHLNVDNHILDETKVLENHNPEYSVLQEKYKEGNSGEQKEITEFEKVSQTTELEPNADKHHTFSDFENLKEIEASGNSTENPTETFFNVCSNQLLKVDNSIESENSANNQRQIDSYHLENENELLNSNDKIQEFENILNEQLCNGINENNAIKKSSTMTTEILDTCYDSTKLISEVRQNASIKSENEEKSLLLDINSCSQDNAKMEMIHNELFNEEKILQEEFINLTECNEKEEISSDNSCKHCNIVKIENNSNSNHIETGIGNNFDCISKNLPEESIENNLSNINPTLPNRTISNCNTILVTQESPEMINICSFSQPISETKKMKISLIYDSGNGSFDSAISETNSPVQNSHLDHSLKDHNLQCVENSDVDNLSRISVLKDNILDRKNVYIADLNNESSFLSNSASPPSKSPDLLYHQIRNSNVHDAIQVLENLSGSLKNLFIEISKVDDSFKFLSDVQNKMSIAHDAKLTEISKQFETEKSNLEFLSLQKLESNKNICNIQSSQILNELVNSISILISTINFSPIFSSLGTLELLISDAVNQNTNSTQKIQLLSNEIETKNCEIINVVQKLDLLQTKSQMLEESVDYLNTQNEKLKFKNHHLGVSINIIMAYVNNIGNSLSELSTFGLSFMELFNKIEKFYNDKYQDLNNGLDDLRNSVKVLKNSIDCIDFEKCKNEFDLQAKKVSELFECEKISLEDRLRQIMEENNLLKREASELKEDNIRLRDMTKELNDEFQIKDAYTKDLEKSIDELMKSNKFYEDQLLHSDEIIKSLKDAKQIKSIEISAEIEKIKKHYLKENGLLRLKIEELENSHNM